MRRILVYLSRPQIFILVMMLLFGLAAATWTIDQYLAWRNNEFHLVQIGVDGSTAGRIVARGELIVGIRNNIPPFGFTTTDGLLNGFDVDIARELAQRWLGSDDALRIQVVTAADSIPQLVSREVDLLIAAMPTRRERDALIDFSQAYFVDQPGFLVRANSSITDLSAMADRTVGIIAGSPVYDIIERESALQSLDLQLGTFGGYPQALDALGAGALDAIAADSMVLFQLAQDNPGLVVIGTSWQPQPYSIGIPQGDSPIRSMVDFTLENMKADGTYDRLYEKWFVASQPPDLQISPGEWNDNLSQLPQETPQLFNPLVQIRERGVIRAGVPQGIAPFGFLDEKGEWNGFDVDVVRELARRWLGNEDAVEFVPGEIVDHVNQLAAGDIDLIAAGMIKRREWAHTVDFSQTYLGPPVVNEPLGIAIPPSAPSFRELLNFTLQEMKRDGIYDTLHVRWFGADRPVYPLEIWPGDADYLLAPYAQQPQPVRMTIAGESTIKRIQHRGDILLTGVVDDAYPFGFQDESGILAGFDVDLIRAIADNWGINVNFTPQKRGSQIAQLLDGEVDLIGAGVVHTKLHEAEIDFSQSYYINGYSMLVTESSGLTEAADLAGVSIAVLNGTLVEDSVRLYLDSNGIDASIEPYDSPDDAINALRTGDVALFATDTVIASELARGDPTLSLFPHPLTQEPYALGMIAGDANFQNLLNQTLFELQQSGIYGDLYAKWFGPDVVAKEITEIPGGWSFRFADAPTDMNRPVLSKAEQLGSRDALIVGIASDQALFSFIDERGQPMGLEVDLIQNIAARWLGDSSAVVFLPINSREYALKLDENAIDMVVGSLIDNQNQDAKIGYSQPYLATDGQSYRLGIPFADDRFRDLVNFTLQEIAQDGTLDRLIDQWLGDEGESAVELWPGQPYFQFDLVPMVSIPSGEFDRGYREGFPDERVEKRIALNSYYIDQFEVTNRQYDRCVRSGQCPSPRYPRSINFSQYFAQAEFGNYPVIWVSWHDAATYCNFVGKRLPTEAEWEYAARGSQNSLYPWGDDQPVDQSNFDYIRLDVVSGGTFPQDRSQFGVYDLAGNVREWVADWYEWDYYVNAPAGNPTGPQVAVTKVLRGGSWNDTSVYTRSTVRRNFLPESVDANLGFRCATSNSPFAR